MSISVQAAGDGEQFGIGSSGGGKHYCAWTRIATAVITADAHARGFRARELAKAREPIAELEA